MQLLAAYLVLMKLSDQIRALRGKTTFSRFAQKTMVNRQTLTELEDGSSVKLSTLKLIKESCGLGQRQWIDLLIGWVRAEIGEENYSLLNVTPAALPWASGQRPKSEALFLKIFSSLSTTDQAQILATMIREPVRSCLPALNRAVKKQRAESRRLIGAIVAKKRLKNRVHASNDLSELIKELREHGLFEDVTNSSEVLLEHALRSSQEELAEELLFEVIVNAPRLSRGVNLSRVYR
jgi:transcriptional regulator with XRE-family HTH domain